MYRNTEQLPDGLFRITCPRCFKLIRTTKTKTYFTLEYCSDCLPIVTERNRLRLEESMAHIERQNAERRAMTPYQKAVDMLHRAFGMAANEGEVDNDDYEYTENGLVLITEDGSRFEVTVKEEQCG